MITIHPCKHLIKDDREEVTQAWYMDDSDEDQRLPHHRNPKEFVTLEKLAELVVLSWRLDDDNYETDAFRVSNLSHEGEGFWLWFCFLRGLVDYMPQVYIKEFSEVWKRFSQFEQTYGDLASMLKVEQRRKEAFCRTGEEGASALESSLQDVVSRYSFMDLWPCSSKDLDNLVWQEALQSDSSWIVFLKLTDTHASTSQMTLMHYLCKEDCFYDLPYNTGY